LQSPSAQHLWLSTRGTFSHPKGERAGQRSCTFRIETFSFSPLASFVLLYLQNHGEDNGAFHHKLFRRGHPELLPKILRTAELKKEQKKALELPLAENEKV
jgi:hypothetical protein